MRRVPRVALGVMLSGTLLVLALPPADVPGLGWIALVPLLVATRGRGAVAGTLAGVATALVAGALSHAGWWYSDNAVAQASVAWNYAGFTLFGFSLGLACGGMAGRTTARERPIAALAAWAVLSEAALLAYQPAHLALAFSEEPALLELAGWTGIWGVSFVAWWVALALTRAVARRDGRWLVAGVLVPLTVVGLRAVAPIDAIVPAEPRLTIAVIQTCHDDRAPLAALNARAARDGAHIAVWPELAGMFEAMNGDTRRWTELAREPGQIPFATSFQDGPSRSLPHNAAALFDGSGESSRYYKRCLFAGEVEMHTPGFHAVAVRTSGVAAALGLNICFDSCFPRVLRETALLPDVGAILLPTLDPPSPHGVVQAIHAAYTPFRSAELGVPIARAERTACSMITDRRGRVVARAGPGGEAIAIATVATTPRWTLYRVWGDWFLGVCAVAVVWGLVQSRRET